MGKFFLAHFLIKATLDFVRPLGNVPPPPTVVKTEQKIHISVNSLKDFHKTFRTGSQNNKSHAMVKTEQNLRYLTY